MRVMKNIRTGLGYCYFQKSDVSQETPLDFILQRNVITIYENPKKICSGIKRVFSPRRYMHYFACAAGLFPLITHYKS